MRACLATSFVPRTRPSDRRWLVVVALSVAWHAALVLDLRWTWVPRVAPPGVPALQVRAIEVPRRATESGTRVAAAPVTSAAPWADRREPDAVTREHAVVPPKAQRPSRAGPLPSMPPAVAEAAATPDRALAGASTSPAPEPELEWPPSTAANLAAVDSGSASPSASAASSSASSLSTIVSAGAASADAEPPPRYPTRFAPALRARYEVTRNRRSAIGVLEWAPDGDGYAIRFDAGALGWAQTSEGRFDAAGLAPLRYLERAPRAQRATNFEADAGRVRYSASSASQPWWPGQQDRLGWLVQLGAVLAAEPARWVAGERIVLSVAGVRGDAARWTFVVEHAPAPDGGGGWHLVRGPAAPHDLAIEAWFDADAPALPARVEWRTATGTLVTAWERLPTDR